MMKKIDFPEPEGPNMRNLSGAGALKKSIATNTGGHDWRRWNTYAPGVRF